MKTYLISTIILLLAFSISINAQNYKTIERIADKLEEAADELTDKTSRDIKKGNAVTGIEIERAFTSEQLSAGTKLMKRLVDEKYPISELQAGSMMLVKMLPNLPKAGLNMNEWNEVKRLINGLNAEINSKPIKKTQPPKTKDIRGKVFWTGKVDAIVQLIIKGTEIKTRTISGKTYPDGIPSFTMAMPTSGNYSIGIKKKDGRGKAKIIQQPNADNDYTAIVEIFDEGGGAKNYTIEIFW